MAIEIGKRRKTRKGDELVNDCQGDTNLVFTREEGATVEDLLPQVHLETSPWGHFLINNFYEKA